jgi:5-methylcytosine-specific restriction protein B
MAKAKRLHGARPSCSVGAAYGGTDDQTQWFIAEGIWKNGRRHKYHDLVRSMRPGDGIAIKASYTRKHCLPFDNQGEFVSVLGIKQLKTITKNLDNGQVVLVDWAPTEPVREWYFFTNRATVWRVLPDNWKNDGLIAFAFEHKPQDIERFQHNNRVFSHADG